MKLIPKFATLLALLLSVSACGSTTVLLANFNSEPVGSPPAANQPTGSVTIQNGDGSVTVAQSPQPGSNWARISHNGSAVGTPETVLRARFDQPRGAGHYSMICALFMPSRTGVATVQFESIFGDISSSPAFLHLDFMPENNVRINDDPNSRFGSFPRDKSFTVSVIIDSSVSPAKATISLNGNGASGETSLDLPSITNQFGAVRVWMGAQHTGTFFVDDILVTRRN